MRLLVLGIALIALGNFSGIVHAQNQTVSEEAIVSYVSNIKVNVDSSIDVIETITYTTGPQERHGIFRDIYLYSSEKRKMSIENIRVVDENGSPHQFQVSDIGDYTRIKIGDPNRTFAGQKVYSISYRAMRAVAQLKDLDEIYWNSTGNEWSMPMYQVEASIALPLGAVGVQTACYYGPEGSTNKCPSPDSNNGTYTFRAPSKLNAHEGLTVAVGFPKGIVASSFFDRYGLLLLAATLPLVTLIISLLYWHKKGRDPKGTGVIVAQYDVPDSVTPMEVGGIVNQKVTAADISAQIIYLATKGYVKIRQIDERVMGVFHAADFELTALKDFSDLPNSFDQKLLRSLFTTDHQPKSSSLAGLLFKSMTVKNPVESAVSSQSVRLSDLKNVFYQDASAVVTGVLNALVRKGYYKNLGKMKYGGGGIFITVFMVLWISLFFGGMVSVFLKENPIPMIVGIFFSIVISAIIYHFSPAKTERGVVIKEYLLGLKEYLQIAEKDRLQFHNAPDKKPEVFEKLLPYAMVLGVVDVWAKEFEGIYTVPPSWYSGAPGSAFNVVAFGNTLQNFSSIAASSLTSSPSTGSGGSGGGGSSGGGGGGGGGGSW